jgi:predicted RNA-binding Zn-ribbon protein involved in translation (DUF1610 family)
MQPEAIIYCSECRQPIVPGEEFARFKVPGQGIYQCFHRRINAGGCWERLLRQRIRNLESSQAERMCS